MGRNHIPGKAPRGLSARIRDATGADAERLTEILNPEIVETTATWTDQTRSEADMATWIEERRAQGFPVIVLESENGSALGYGSYGAFRSWPGYRHTVEHSVYVARDARGLGAGRALIEALERRARSAGMQAMIGGIGSENAESLAIHKRLGFDEVGRLPEVGRKFDRWLTLVLVQKTLRDKAPSPAQKPGGLLRVYDPDYLSWMIRKFFDVFIGRSPAFEPDPGRSAQLAAAALLVEAARSDGEYTTDERAAIDRVLAETYGASVSEAAQLRVEAETAQSAAVGSHRFTAAVKNAMTYEERVELVESLWRVVLSDGERHEAEDALMRKIVGLIYVEDRDSALARRRALEAADGSSADR